MVAVNRLVWAHTSCTQFVLLGWFPITSCCRKKVGQIQLCYVVSTLIWSGWVWESCGSPLGLTSGRNSFCLVWHWHFLFSVIWELVVVSTAESLLSADVYHPFGQSRGASWGRCAAAALNCLSLHITGFLEVLKGSFQPPCIFVHIA